MPTLEPCPNFNGGEWLHSKSATTPVFNPSVGEVIVEFPVGSTADVNAAVEVAAAAARAKLK
jgi:acyl-CoA reductase-like NAD-dependent aldehyde dehydrogenase